ncbi:uncharacterized protein [Nicotiana sylvestris]|uniref:uncharacterized protein n=1 Tax=Nicotiana sylvestris TaxID=4096 RepID=UPI00388C9587
MSHKLNEDPSYPPVKQKKRNQGSFKNQVIQDEVQKLLNIGYFSDSSKIQYEAKSKKCAFDVASAKPKDRERLLIYLVVSEVAVSAMLVREDKDAETQYPHLEKLVLALIMASRKLRPYFQCHPISVITSFPLRNILHKKELSGRLAKWAIELSEYDIIYQSRTAIKAQVLANFIGDFSTNLVLEAEKEIQVVVNQMQETYIAKEARMQQYLKKVGVLVRQFQSGKAVQIPREENAEVDALANLASVTEIKTPKNAIVIHLFHSALNQDKNEYGLLLEDKKKSQLLRQKVARSMSFQTVTGKKVRDFIWRNIIFHFGVSKEILCDNFPQFIGMKIIEFFQSCQIKRITYAPYHLVANRQAESTNKVIINNLKKRLEESKGKRPQVLPRVLWAYRTITKTSTSETLFSLIYGTKDLIPVEIGEPSTRYTYDTEESNLEEMRMNLDLLEERREATVIRMAAQKLMIERYYNRKANLRYFKIGDFVLKKAFRSIKMANVGKLSPNWEGPYRVRGISGKGAYELETMDGNILPSNWNDVHLKKCYF